MKPKSGKKKISEFPKKNPQISEGIQGIPAGVAVTARRRRAPRRTTWRTSTSSSSMKPTCSSPGKGFFWDGIQFLGGHGLGKPLGKFNPRPGGIRGSIEKKKKIQ